MLVKGKYKYVVTHYAPAVYAVPRNSICILMLQGVPSESQIQNESAVMIADKVVAGSRNIAKEWKSKHGLDVPINVVHNGIDFKYFHPNKMVKKDVDIFYVGRLIKIKGVQYLLRAISLLLMKNKDMALRVFIGGSGPYKGELEKMVKKFHLERTVGFLGYIPDKKLRSFYQRSKICVFPSYEKEGVLTTLLEAASCGGAVVTSKCCGMVDFVRDNYNGLLCKPKNSRDLASKIQDLLKSEQKRDYLGGNARKTIESEWGWEYSVRNFIKTLKLR